ncbi:hypothetical protein RND81_06G049200 [Saponaria officinalis]|uniref:TOD1/MUCI70 glycosyltransferase-like domain-containing protein n=1 Tax=Saponaria officinalis TaxID=3572 RepID=A0AAW1K922_SAPOF
MAQYRQYNNSSSTAGNHHLYTNGDGGVGGASTSSAVASSSSSAVADVVIGVRGGHHHHYHHKKSHHHRRLKNRRISIGTAITVVCFVFVASAFGFLYFSTSDHSGNDPSSVQDETYKDDFLKNVTRYDTAKVKFGHGSTTHGRDSRYWDGDDRRRDEDYNEDEVHKSSLDGKDRSEKEHITILVKSPAKPSNDAKSGSGHHGLYNEAGRDELKMYEEKYEASLKNVGQSGEETVDVIHVSDDHKLDMENEETDNDDEYDDGIDSHDAHIEDYIDSKHQNEMHTKLPKSHSGDHEVDIGKGRVLVDQSSSNDSSAKSNSDKSSGKAKHASTADGQSDTSSGKRLKKRRKHHSSSSCEMKLLNSTAQLVEPLESRKFSRFSLSYNQKEEKPDGVDQWEPRFAGHQSLREREDSFIARDQTINCGFVKGPKEYSGTGFDLAEDDYRYISKCHIAVISCIFGNSDRLRSPFTKAVSRLSRKNVCFVMFMDEMTLQTLSSEGQMPDRMGYIGLWKVVVVKNLPFTDMRRVGKIPKLLSHRLFPSARYSIWLDSKLRLQQDPLLLLENFLWRKGYEYAISNHYDRHCVWKEVERNKKLNKFNHTMIDQQFQFYQADGLKRFNASDPNKLLPSNVPEGSLIIRAHTPMSNLFSCLWFNEVDRFTPRDQLSFAYTYQKLTKKNPNKPFYLHMFKDCERRQIAKLFRHRTDQKHNSAQVSAE